MTTTKKPALWRRPWTLPLGILVTAFLVFSLPPYFGLDVTKSRIPPPSGVAWYYPMLVAHIGFASIAMVTCTLQIWPWLRQHHPVAHRRIERVYVFGGALPASIAGFCIALAAPFGPVGAASSTILAMLWAFCTITGYRMARARRFGEHRRWMIRSFVLCMSIITNRIWAVVWSLTLESQLDTTFGGSPVAMGQAIAALSSWLGWTIPLLLAQAWLDRGRGRKRTPSQPEPATAHRA